MGRCIGVSGDVEAGGDDEGDAGGGDCGEEGGESENGGHDQDVHFVRGIYEVFFMSMRRGHRKAKAAWST